MKFPRSRRRKERRPEPRTEVKGAVKRSETESVAALDRRSSAGRSGWRRRHRGNFLGEPECFLPFCFCLRSQLCKRMALLAFSAIFFHASERFLRVSFFILTPCAGRQKEARRVPPSADARRAWKQWRIIQTPSPAEPLRLSGPQVE
jgi:hypothetical protein